jgi:hypothetical protein
MISKMTYPTDRHYYDQNIDNSRVAINSSLVSRAFTFTGNAGQVYTYGGSVNQIQPHSARLQFIESDDPVDVTVWADRTILLKKANTPTNNYLLTLTIPGFPFDLDKDGFYNLPLSLMNTGICTELQVELSGTGNWTLFQLKMTAFEAMPLESV